MRFLKTAGKLLAWGVGSTVLLFVLIIGFVLVGFAAGWIERPKEKPQIEAPARPPEEVTTPEEIATPTPAVASKGAPVLDEAQQEAPAAPVEEPTSEDPGITAEDLERGKRVVASYESILARAKRELPNPRGSNLQACGVAMRELLPLAREAYDVKVGLSLVPLSAPGVPLQSCVTCLDSAPSSCTEAEGGIRAAKALIERIESAHRRGERVPDDFDSLKAIRLEVSKALEGEFEKTKRGARCLAASATEAAYWSAFEAEEGKRWKAIRAAECVQ